ncbi:MAG: hypothetical protein ABII72_04905 [Parcubacteria group bacterium]
MNKLLLLPIICIISVFLFSPASSDAASGSFNRFLVDITTDTAIYVWSDFSFSDMDKTPSIYFYSQEATNGDRAAWVLQDAISYTSTDLWEYEDEDYMSGVYSMGTTKELKSGTQYNLKLVLTIEGEEVASKTTTGTTLDSAPQITDVYPKHIVRGDTVKFYGDNLVGEHTNGYSVSFDDNDQEYTEHLIPDFDWTNTMITAEVMDYFRVYQGKSSRGRLTVHRQYEVSPRREPNTGYIDMPAIETTYDVQIATSTDYLDHTIQSNYKGRDYQYLYNALALRYRSSIVRDEAQIQQEQAEAQNFRQRIKSRLGRDIGVDSLWFLNLFYARYYGGYTDEDIVKEIQYGPCGIHAVIAKNAWQETSEYKNCGE